MSESLLEMAPVSLSAGEGRMLLMYIWVKRHFREVSGGQEGVKVFTTGFKESVFTSLILRLSKI